MTGSDAVTEFPDGTATDESPASEPTLGSPGGDQDQSDSDRAGDVEDASTDDDGPGLQPTPATPGEIPSLFPDSDEAQPPPAGTRPTLENGDINEPAQPDESDVSIRLLSHLEHVRDSRRRTVGTIDAHITHIVCETHQTSRGMTVLIEPRNAEGTFVGLPGSVSVVVLDGDERGQQARVARWDKSAEEAAGRLQDSLIKRGIDLEFEWPAESHFSDNLQVYIRYTTVDGRHIQTQQKLGPAEEPGEPLKLFADERGSDWEVQGSSSEFEVVSADETGWTVVRRDQEPPAKSKNAWGQTAKIGNETIVSHFGVNEPVVPAEPKPFVQRMAKREQKLSQPTGSPTGVRSVASPRSTKATKIPKDRPKPLNKLSADKMARVSSVPAKAEALSTVENKPEAKPTEKTTSMPRLVKATEEKTPQIPKWSPDRK